MPQCFGCSMYLRTLKSTLIYLLQSISLVNNFIFIRRRKIRKIKFKSKVAAQNYWSEAQSSEFNIPLMYYRHHVTENHVYSRAPCFLYILATPQYFINDICFNNLTTTFVYFLENRLPIVQGGTFAFLTPVFAILSLDKWKCPDGPPGGSPVSLFFSRVAFGYFTNNLSH